MIIKFKKYPITIITVFIWIGFICSISFMEAWLKFYAANVTVPIGLSIGRLVFNTLNKVEWAFTAIIIAHVMLRRKNPPLIFFNISAVMLIIQTFLILPALNERVEIILQGSEVLHSSFHLYYLFTEVIKVISLFLFGMSSIRFYKAKLNGI